MAKPRLEKVDTVATRHDVFISYSHTESALARSLKKSLEGLSKKWHQRRARRVFLDEASIPTGALLESSVVTALNESDAFLLIASTAAGKSLWVNSELEYWLAGNDTHNLFIVLAEGSIAWDRTTGGFDPAATNALPGAALTCFASEPLWEDLRGWDKQNEHDRILSVTAGIIAAMSGTPKDEVYHEDIRQQRLVKRLALGVATILSLLVVSLVAVSLVAIHQRDIARTNGAIATAHAMAASAKSLLQSRLSTALHQALAAHEIRDDVYTRASLLEALSYDPHLVRFCRTTDYIHGLSWDGDSARILAWSPSFVSLCDTSTGGLLNLAADGRPSAVVGSPGAGEVVAVGERSGQLQLDVAATGVRLWGEPALSDSIESLAFSPDGRKIAVVSRLGAVAVVRRSDGSLLERASLDASTLHGRITTITFENHGTTLLVITDLGDGRVLSGYPLSAHPAATGPGLPLTGRRPTSIASTVLGTSLSYLQHGSISNLVISGHPAQPHFPANLSQRSGAFTVSDDGRLAAVEQNGLVSIVTARRAGTRRVAPVRLPGAATVGSLLSISSDDSLLASSYGRVVGVWKVLGDVGVASSFPVTAASQPANGTRQAILSDPSAGTAMILTGGPARPGAAQRTGLSCWDSSNARITTHVQLPVGDNVTAASWNQGHTKVFVATSTPPEIGSLPMDHGCPTGQLSTLASIDARGYGRITGLASLADLTLVLMEGASLHRLDRSGANVQSWGEGSLGGHHVSSFAVSPDGHELLVGYNNGVSAEVRTGERHVATSMERPAGNRKGRVARLPLQRFGGRLQRRRQHLPDGPRHRGPDQAAWRRPGLRPCTGRQWLDARRNGTWLPSGRLGRCHGSADDQLHILVSRGSRIWPQRVPTSAADVSCSRRCGVPVVRGALLRRDALGLQRPSMG